MIQQISALGLQELEAGVSKLSRDELRAFSRWFEEFRASVQSNANEIGSSDETEQDHEELSPEDTADLPPLSQEWIDEINRRSREIDEGLVQPVPFEDVMVRMKRLCEE